MYFIIFVNFFVTVTQTIYVTERWDVTSQRTTISSPITNNITNIELNSQNVATSNYANLRALALQDLAWWFSQLSILDRNTNTTTNNQTLPVAISDTQRINVSTTTAQTVNVTETLARIISEPDISRGVVEPPRLVESTTCYCPPPPVSTTPPPTLKPLGKCR